MTKSLVKNIFKRFANSSETSFTFLKKNVATVVPNPIFSKRAVIFIPKDNLDKKTQEIMEGLLRKHSKAWKDLANR